MWKKAFSKQVEEEAETTKLVNDIMGGPISSDSPAPTPLASPAAVASTGASGSVGSKKKSTKKKSEKKKKKEEAASSWNIPIIATAAAALAIAGVVWLRSRRS
jgi:cobalamin biosynthesis Mg chelatase CobN